MTPEWITAIVAVIALVGGGIWAAVTYFASNRYAEALQQNVDELKKEFGQLKLMVETYISNVEYFKGQMQKKDEALEKNQATLENVDELFRTIDARLKDGTLGKAS